jgi:hypothetical protein
LRTGYILPDRPRGLKTLSFGYTESYGSGPEITLWSLLWANVSETHRRKLLHEILSAPLPEFDDGGSLAFVDMDQAIPENVDFIVAGHTRRPASAYRRRGQGYYLNPGSWTSQLFVERGLPETEELRAFRMLLGAPLDELRRSGLLIAKRYVAVIRSTGETVNGGLSELVWRRGEWELITT